jgi:hypothetical protein
MPETEKQALWIGIGKQVISGMVGALVASFLLGGARQKVVAVGKDMAEWKEEWKTVHKPHIDRMDSVGSLSFDHWKLGYEKEEKRTDDRLKTLETEMKELQRQRKIDLTTNNDHGTN